VYRRPGGATDDQSGPRAPPRLLPDLQPALMPLEPGQQGAGHRCVLLPRRNACQPAANPVS
ncbi:hypothetical protein, partial [Aerococcus urinae]|uniref:hypothetical protein n=1 Tax=Aerococcus urinae TaxID=1376 RepID=UPI00254A4BF5